MISSFGRTGMPVLVAALVSMASLRAQGSECLDGAACPAFELSAGYTADFRRNAAGGLATGNAASGLLQVGAQWTSDSFLPGAVVTTAASMIHSHGGAVSGNLVGDLQGLNNIEAPVGLRMYELWSEVSFGSKQQLSTRAGLLDLNAEFDAPVTSAFFIGPPFGIGTDLAQTGENGPAVFPVTSLGLRIAGMLGETISWRAAAFDGVPGRVDRNSFAPVDVSRRQGALLIGEMEFSLRRLNKLAFGAWSYTAAFETIDAQVSGAGARRGNRGGYAMIDMPLGNINAARIDGVLRAGIADARFNAVSTYVGTAVVATHLLPGRPEDAVGVAVAHGRTGARFRSALAFDGGLPLKSETAVELTWRAPIRPWLALVPSMQWVESPGADRSLRNAWIVGARFEMSFDHSWSLLAKRRAAADGTSLANATP